MDATVPQGLCVALYKGTRPGMAGIYNRIGRYLDRGPYSHCEVLFSNRVSGSSSFLDHGVRFKDIGYSSVGNWDFLPIPDPTGAIEVAAWDWMTQHVGAAYDVMGNLRFATNFARDDEDKWFCSEAKMSMFGFPEAYRFGPSGGATILQYHFKSKIIEVFA